MSWPHVQKVLLTKRPRWTTPAQQAVLTKWAQYYNDKWGYAYPKPRELEAALGMSRGTLNRVTRQLETLGVGGRLEASLGDGARLKYVIFPEAFEDRRHDCGQARATLDLDDEAPCPWCVGSPIADIDGATVERRGEPLPETAPTPTPRPLFAVLENDQGADHQRSAPPDHQRSAPLITGDQPGDIGTDLVRRSSTSSTGTAAQARLHALLVAQQKKRQHLATDPADDGNYRQALKAAYDVLGDPQVGARLRIEDYDPGKDDDVCWAMELLLQRRHILVRAHPKVKRDIVARALTAARIALQIANGGQRPREAADAARLARRRHLRGSR